MEEKKKNSNKMSVGEIVIIALFLLATVGQALLWFSISVVRAEEYRRVYDNVLSLTAIVISLPILVKTFAFCASVFSFLCLMLLHLLCPDIFIYLFFNNFCFD